MMTILHSNWPQTAAGATKAPRLRPPLQSVGLAQRRGGDNDDVRNAPGQDVVQSHAFSHITTQQGTRHYLTTENLPLSEHDPKAAAHMMPTHSL